MIRGNGRWQLHLTADKRQNFISPKLPSATSFIRKTLYKIESKERDQNMDNKI